MTPTPHRLLVVGGNGFIGRHVVVRGLERNWQVTSLGRTSPALPARVAGVSYLAADIAQIEALRTVLSGRSFEYVVNCGGTIDHRPFASEGGRVFEAHFKGVMNLAALLDRTALRSFVNIGSSDEYGGNPAPQSEEQRENPISPYSLGKTAATHFLQTLHRTEAFPAATARLFLTYGPGQDLCRFLPQIIKGCLQNESFATSEGRQVRDFCYVADTVSGIFAALESAASRGEVINIASGRPLQIREMIEQVRDLIGGGTPLWGKVAYRPGENMRLVADISKARRLLGWEPKVSLLEGLKATIASIRDSVPA